MNTLKTIQTLAKIAKIVSKIVFICCIIGICGCIIGIICFAIGTETLKINGINIEEFLQSEAGISSGTLYCYMTAGVFICLGEGVVAKFAEIYFRHEISQGTPFFKEGVRELFRLGILTICMPLVAIIFADIAQSIIAHAIENSVALELNGSTSIGTGLSFLILSLLCKLGVEQSEQFCKKSANDSMETDHKANNAAEQ